MNIFIALTLCHLFILTKSQPVIPNLSGKCYVDQQDLNIGVNLHVSARGEGDMYCSPELDPRSFRVQQLEVVKYAIMDINKNASILPNITLGYVIADGCNRDSVSLARAFSFIPDRNTSVWNPVKPGGAMVEDCGRYIKTYPVVGMIGPPTSRGAVMVAPVLR